MKLLLNGMVKQLMRLKKVNQIYSTCYLKAGQNQYIMDEDIYI